MFIKGLQELCELSLSESEPWFWFWSSRFCLTDGLRRSPVSLRTPVSDWLDQTEPLARYRFINGPVQVSPARTFSVSVK